jgi:hypothetical protein
LRAIARLRARSLPGGVSWSDLPQEAVVRALAGMRPWPPDVPPRILWKRPRNRMTGYNLPVAKGANPAGHADQSERPFRVDLTRLAVALMDGSLRRAQSWEERERCRVNMLAGWFWRALDAFDYRVMQSRMRVVDAIYGPEPETEAERQRRCAREPWRRSGRDQPPG